MRTLFYSALLVLAVFFLFAHLAQLEAVLETLQRGRQHWLLLGALLELVWLVNLATLYRAVYRVLGVEAPLSRLILIASAANFTLVVASSFGSLAIFIDDGRRNNLGSGRVALAALLFIWVDYMAFIAVLSLGFVVLIRRNSTTLPEIVAALILVSIAAAFGGLLLLGVYSAQKLEAVLVWLVRRVNRSVGLIKQGYLSEATAHRFATDTATAFKRLRRDPQSLWLPFALALSARALHISIFFLVFLAFRQAFSAGTLIAGYSIASLFTIISPTPGGLAVVESVMVVTLRTLRIPLASATAITLAFRGLTFWLPFGLGFFALRFLNRSGADVSRTQIFTDLADQG